MIAVTLLAIGAHRGAQISAARDEDLAVLAGGQPVQRSNTAPARSRESAAVGGAAGGRTPRRFRPRRTLTK